MNKYLLLTSAALIGMATPGAEKARAGGGGPYTIQFNGYCDGLTFHRTNAPPIVMGEHLNNDCAGGTSAVMGTVNKKEFLLFDTEFSNYRSIQFAYAIYKPIRSGGQWASFVCFSGTSCFLGGSGTYSLGCCAARNSGTPIKSKVAEIIAQRRAARQSASGR